MSEPLQIVEDANGIRRFSSQGVQDAIDRAIATLGPDDHFAIVAHGDGGSETGASISAVVRTSKGFSLAASAFKPWRKPIEFGAAVVWKPF